MAAILDFKMATINTMYMIVMLPTAHHTPVNSSYTRTVSVAKKSTSSILDASCTVFFLKTSSKLVFFSSGWLLVLSNQHNQGLPLGLCPVIFMLSATFITKSSSLLFYHMTMVSHLFTSTIGTILHTFL